MRSFIEQHNRAQARVIVPRPLQCEAAMFLAARSHALLASEPRTGKTGSAIIGLEMASCKRVLVITTASGRAVWKSAFGTWAAHRPPPVIVPDTKRVPEGDTVIVSWAGTAAPAIRHALSAVGWDLVIADESHYCANPATKRTIAVFGDEAGRTGICASAKRVWCLTGTPTPNAPCDLHPTLRAIAPERLLADEARGWPDVSSYEAFYQRYVKWKIKRLSRFRSIRVAMGGQRIPELRERLAGLWLRHTQQDVGIRPPQFEMLPLTVSAKQRAAIEKQADGKLRDILAAADAATTQDMEMHFGPLRRLTGAIKAEAVAELVREELNCGVRKIVLMCWHVDVINWLVTDSLASYGAVALHGGTTTSARTANINRFQTDPDCRVMVGQLQAAGEAVDLSAADELIFVETDFKPSVMQQAALRVTNLGKDSKVRVRVAALAGSIDEAIQTVLTRKIASIRELHS